MKPGDLVTDGPDRTRGEILRVGRALPRVSGHRAGLHAGQRPADAVYVLWLPELPDDRA